MIHIYDMHLSATIKALLKQNDLDQAFQVGLPLLAPAPCKIL